MKTKYFCVWALVYCCQIMVGQEINSKTQFHLDLSYTNPFQKENQFTRIGSILGIKAGLTFQLENDNYIGFDVSSSLFFPNGGGELGTPKILPQGRLKFSNSTRLFTEIAIGALYNPSSIGYEANFSYALNPNNSKNIFSLYLNGVSQTFDNPTNEIRKNAPISSIYIFGAKYVKPLPKKFVLIFKPGIGIRTDSDKSTKFVLNGSTVLAWRYFSVVGAYTNKVPERGFPTYFVLSGGVDFAKIYYDIKAKSQPDSNKENATPTYQYHENILSN